MSKLDEQRGELSHAWNIVFTRHADLPLCDLQVLARELTSAVERRVSLMSTSSAPQEKFGGAE